MQTRFGGGPGGRERRLSAVGLARARGTVLPALAEWRIGAAAYVQ